MSKRLVDKQHSIETLQEMIRDRKKDEPVEEILSIFCERYGVEMKDCRNLYNELVAQGKIKEK
jgi:chromosomal replication initiation ATPase DnaA